jgi:hypothetical protein
MLSYAENKEVRSKLWILMIIKVFLTNRV